MIDSIINTPTFGEVYRLLEILLANLVSSELEEEIGGLPLVKQCFLTAHPPAIVKVFKKCLDGIRRAFDNQKPPTALLPTTNSQPPTALYNPANPKILSILIQTRETTDCQQLTAKN